MSDAFDKEGHYYEDSDFALDLNLQDKRRELLYLLEDDNALVLLNSCEQELMNLLEPAPRRESNILASDDVLVDNAEELQSQASKVKPKKLLQADNILVADAKVEQAENDAASSSKQGNPLKNHDNLSPKRELEALGTPSSRQGNLEADDNLVSPPPSALPLPIWTHTDLVGSWLEQSMEDFTLRYYADTVQEFFRNFEPRGKNYCYF